MFRAELVKLKRSSTWLIAAILPLLAVTTGTINLANNRDVLNSGWASFTSQVVLFYGMLFFSLGIGLLASTVWRMEHRGTNWYLVLTTTTRPSSLVLAKAGVIAVPINFRLTGPEVAYIANDAEYRPIPTIWGHRAGNPAKHPEDQRFLAQTIADLLSAQQSQPDS